ncbi:hypothetical protein GCM10010919_01320 [Alishewanella longhuensis]|uniref:HTH LytTR-type domain-containing protein n=1 Tax=Alishewanella longhuensis TaxID=1091037 RepID=A0ABQ3L1N2_9ALTE|nr:LytTR family DNA-binding domain-containing protein [Alishewanella longhuensis]GHG59085.1 hypothetical protein GCM10010919_01320 [Alishewanella longhuensis]
MTKNVKVTLEAKLRQHPVACAYVVLSLFLLINATVNASSAWTDLQRAAVTGTALWEPFLWEYSSALSTLLWCPLLFWWFTRYPLRLAQFGRQLLCHLAASLMYALLHIITMIVLRQPIYHLLGGHYGFEPLTADFLYEYRKDAWAYVFFLCCFYIARFIHSRLTGEAHTLDQAENTIPASLTEDRQPAPNYYLVKKLDKEFLLATTDIEWLEANGNYVNLHSQGRIYPLRATLSATILQLAPIGFCRIHRSLAVNVNKVVSVQYQSSGDGEVHLQSAAKISLSRRYKEDFKRQWQIG